MTSKPPHPGRTPAQRRALDAIGCGNPCPPMSRATRKALIDAGLIEQRDSQTVGRDTLGAITIPVYEMPIPVHVAWCAAVALTDDEMMAFETEHPS